MGSGVTALAAEDDKSPAKIVETGGELLVARSMSEMEAGAVEAGAVPMLIMPVPRALLGVGASPAVPFVNGVVVLK